MALATTCWGEKGSEQHKQDLARVDELKNNWWKPLIDRGAEMFNLNNTEDGKSAEDVLNHILRTGVSKLDILMQTELVKEKKKVKKTSAGKVLSEDINERIREVDEEREELRTDLRENDDPILREDLSELDEESRLLKLQRARLNGNMFGVLLYKAGFGV